MLFTTTPRRFIPTHEGGAPVVPKTARVTTTATRAKSRAGVRKQPQRAPVFASPCENNRNAHHFSRRRAKTTATRAKSRGTNVKKAAAVADFVTRLPENLEKVRRFVTLS
jgi:hypothetical protein